MAIPANCTLRPAKRSGPIRKPHGLQMKTAIVTIAIGAAYSARFRAHCEGGWSRYADRHGFQLVRSVFDQGYFLHLAGLKDSVNEFLTHLTKRQN
jgi:poly(3-hydroxybutyrate) depolymerase